MNNEDEREDMLSILRQYRPVYFTVFLVQVIVWCIILSWWESISGEHTTDTIGRVIAIGTKMAPLAGLSVITTIVLVEIGRYLVVLFLPTPKIRRKIREEAIAEGMAEGMAAGKAAGIAAGKAAGKAAGIAAGKAAGIAAGKAAERRNWVDWNRRRKEAEEQGLPFHESPPGDDETT